MAKSLSSADSSQLLKNNDPINISRTISNNEEDDNGIPRQVTRLEQEIHNMEQELRNQIPAQQSLRRRLQP